VAEWIAERARSSSKRSGLACEAIRTNGNKVWGGVGVYTVCELFMDSGEFFNCVSMIYELKLLLDLSPFLTEQEVFDSPSRTARLCEALWSYAHRSHNEILFVLCFYFYPLMY